MIHSCVLLLVGQISCIHHEASHFAIVCHTPTVRRVYSVNFTPKPHQIFMIKALCGKFSLSFFHQFFLDWKLDSKFFLAALTAFYLPDKLINSFIRCNEFSFRNWTKPYQTYMTNQPDLIPS